MAVAFSTTTSFSQSSTTISICVLARLFGIPEIAFASSYPIILHRELNLKSPIYEETAMNGHFGNDRFAWEKPKVLKIRPEIQAKLNASRTL